jgi:spoIIIJ-associated protein
MDQDAIFAHIAQLVVDIASRMGIVVTVEREDSLQYGHVFNINTHDSYALIGKAGSHLHALTVLVKMIAAKQLGQTIPPFLIDIDDYYRKRLWHIKDMVRKGIQQVQRTGQIVTLEPMPHYERRIVHALAQEQFSGVLTGSAGREPYRYVVIRPVEK